MQRRLLVLALLAWALTPTIEAQPESAYYGFQLTKHFALEGGYGETSTIRATALASPPPTELGFETKLHKIFAIRGLGTLPFDNGLSLIAGVGFFTFEQDVALSINGAPFLGGDVDPEGFGNFAYYLGAQYDWDRVALRLSYEKWDFGSDARLVFVGSDAQEVALSFFYKL